MRRQNGAMTAGQARQLLGLSHGADAASIDRAYRAAVKAAHPDREGGDAELLRRVIDAHRLLKSLIEVRLNFAPATREPPAAPARPAAPKPAGPHSLSLQIAVSEAMFGGERRIGIPDGGQLDVRLPAGLRAGESLRLAGAGPDGRDVMLRITVAVEPGLHIRGDDLWLDLSAPPHELSEGSRLEIDTPRGRRAFLAPKAVETGAMVRLKGEGLPSRGRHPMGDLIVRLTLDDASGETVSQRLLRRFSARWAA